MPPDGKKVMPHSLALKKKKSNGNSINYLFMEDKRTMEMQISKILLFKKKKKDYLFPQVNYKEKRRDEERLARLKSLNDIPT